jgi:hypothetical protein
MEDAYSRRLPHKAGLVNSRAVAPSTKTMPILLRLLIPSTNRTRAVRISKKTMRRARTPQV